jgi:ribosomal protein L31E
MLNSEILSSKVSHLNDLQQNTTAGENDDKFTLTSFEAKKMLKISLMSSTFDKWKYTSRELQQNSNMKQNSRFDKENTNQSVNSNSQRRSNGSKRSSRSSRSKRSSKSVDMLKSSPNLAKNTAINQALDILGANPYILERLFTIENESVIMHLNIEGKWTQVPLNKIHFYNLCKNGEKMDYWNAARRVLANVKNFSNQKFKLDEVIAMLTGFNVQNMKIQNYLLDS